MISRIASWLGIGMLTSAASAFAASAPILRCTGPDGAVSYQQQPCPAAAATRIVPVPSAYPEADPSERERLFRREAALDARMLKRAQLDTAERIAREERLARERAIEAARDAAREAEVPSYIVLRPAWPGRFPGHHAHRPPRPIWR
jgi:hypothetical protein